MRGKVMMLTMWLIGAMVCLLTAPQVLLSTCP